MDAQMIGHAGKYPQFDNLRTLALNPSTIEEFYDSAAQEVARLADELFKIRNTDLLLERYYQSRIVLIRALMGVQTDWLGHIHRNAPGRKDS